MAVQIDDEALLTRSQAAAALRDAGFPVADKTLARKASVGGGPAFRRFGRTPLYRWADLRRWAEGRLSPPMDSTSDITGSGVGGA